MILKFFEASSVFALPTLFLENGSLRQYEKNARKRGGLISSSASLQVPGGAFCHIFVLVWNAGLIVVNAWYGKFVNDNSRKNEKVKVIDVTVPLQCLVKDSKLILTEASKVCNDMC